ncbi:hypothetical protein FX985_03381 [Pseudomonas extremaustralis]|uniref:Uncharacterized protein n=1 Tax=Pseudomonas extremaustralis TaxID=359110 RepID=A0A5M9J5U3_9PSED|nr:hypothetical protein FX985_03381 [Pseudomonas extremaustralis]
MGTGAGAYKTRLLVHQLRGIIMSHTQPQLRESVPCRVQCIGFQEGHSHPATPMFWPYMDGAKLCVILLRYPE